MAMNGDGLKLRPFRLIRAPVWAAPGDCLLLRVLHGKKSTLPAPFDTQGSAQDNRCGRCSIARGTGQPRRHDVEKLVRVRPWISASLSQEVGSWHPRQFL